MPRHGKNSTYSPVFTYYERQKATKASGWGSQKARIDKDSQKEFDCCSLTLQPCKDPVVTPDGHLYNRESILEYILHHKQENARKMKAYEKQLKNDEKKTEEEMSKEEKDKLEKFLGFERSITTKRDNPFSSSDAGEASTSKKPKKEETEESIVNTNEKEKSKLPSFWIPDLTPQAEKTRLEKPDMNVYCPMSGKLLRMKDLVTVKFKLAPVEDGKSFMERKERYICAVSHDALFNAVPSAVLRPTGDVITMDYVEKFIKKDWICPITGKKLRKKDIIELKRGGTGFASAADGQALEAKTYGPALTC